MATKKEKIIGLITSLNEINNLNRGGCLFAAYATYLKAKELGIKITIVQLDWNGGFAINNNKAFLKGEVSKPVAGNHYVIKIGKDLIDSQGIYSDAGDQLFPIEDKYTDKLCIPSLKSNDWNNRFDREDGVKQIKKILGIDLSHCL